MRIAVLSGKGGTGKTFVSVNLACVAEKAVYVDCDVEEPNGHLFLKPEITLFFGPVLPSMMPWTFGRLSPLRHASGSNGMCL